MLCCPLTHQPGEGLLPEQEVCALLVLADLGQGLGSWPIPPLACRGFWKAGTEVFELNQ